VTKEDVDRLFRMASRVGFEYDIPLIGDDAIVVHEGYEKGDYRISDSEHIIHELAHCVLLGVSFDKPHDELLNRLDAKMRSLSHRDQCINEIEVFSVTMEVMRRMNITFDEQNYLTQLLRQLNGFEAPEGFDTGDCVRAFHTTGRGKVAVETIIKMLEEKES
jgi:hypothetical protein